MTPIDQTFTPDNADWQHVSTRLSAARRVSATIVFVIVLIGAIVLWFVQGVPRPLPLELACVAVVGYLWSLWYIGRRTKSWAFAERDDDLVVVRGIMFKRLVIVPYGRMQLVDLAAGPVDRAFGIAKLQLHTAAATTDATIPGLVPEVAAALRDRLAELGEQRAAGL